MRLISSKKVSASEVLSSRPGEFLVIAAGGLAMLLVVGIFDMVGLLP